MFRTHRGYQNRALRIKGDLQTRNLAQIESAKTHPVDKAQSSQLAQGHQLANVRRYASLQFVQKSLRNKVRRPSPVPPLGESRKARDCDSRLGKDPADSLVTNLRSASGHT